MVLVPSGVEGSEVELSSQLCYGVRHISAAVFGASVSSRELPFAVGVRVPVSRGGRLTGSDSRAVTFRPPQADLGVRKLASALLLAGACSRSLQLSPSAKRNLMSESYPSFWLCRCRGGPLCPPSTFYAFRKLLREGRRILVTSFFDLFKPKSPPFPSERMAHPRVFALQ